MAMYNDNGRIQGIPAGPDRGHESRLGGTTPVRPEGEVVSLIGILTSRLEFQRELLDRLYDHIKPVLCEQLSEAEPNTKGEHFSVSCPLSDAVAGLINKVDSANRGLNQLCQQIRL